MIKHWHLWLSCTATKFDDSTSFYDEIFTSNRIHSFQNENEEISERLKIYSLTE